MPYQVPLPEELFLGNHPEHNHSYNHPELHGQEESLLSVYLEPKVPDPYTS